MGGNKGVGVIDINPIIYDGLFVQTLEGYVKPGMHNPHKRKPNDSRELIRYERITRQPVE